MRRIFVQHRIAFVFAAIAGAFMLAPQLVFIMQLGSSYQGIYMMNSDAEPHYVARMEAFYKGDGVGNPYYFENKNDVPDVYYTFSESIVAIPGYILHISAPVINLIYKFVFPAIVFILSYFLVYRVTRRRLWSLAGASLIIFGNLLLSIPDLINFIHFNKTYTEFALFSRPINPEFTSIVFFGYLHVMLSAMRSKKNTWFIWLAALFGFSCYAYFYSWTFILAFNACLFVILAWRTEYRDVSWKLVCVTIVGLALGSRAIYELILVKTSPLASDLGNIYLAYSHRPIVSIAGIIITILFAWHFFKHRKKEHTAEDLFFAGLLLAALLDINQQILTGISIQTGHYHWYFNTPIYMMTIAYLGAGHLRSLVSKNIEQTAVIALIILSVYSCAWAQYSSYINDYSETASDQVYGPVFQWLNGHAPKDSVVMPDDNMSELIPAYTSMNVFESSYGKYYLLSPVRRAYGDVQALSDLASGIGVPFRLDYIVWDTIADPSWQLDRISSLKEMYDDGRFKIYVY